MQPQEIIITPAPKRLIGHWVLPVVICVVLLVIIIIVQAFVLAKYSLPFVTLDGHQIGLSSQVELYQRLDSLIDAHQLQVVTPKKTYQTNAAELGLRADHQAAGRVAFQHRKLRLVPLSYLYYLLTVRSELANLKHLDQSKVSSFASMVARENNTTTITASVQQSGDDFNLQLVNQEKDYFEASNLEGYIMQNLVYRVKQIVVKPQSLVDVIKSSQFSAIKSRLKLLSKMPVDLQVADKSFQLRFADFLEAVSIAADPNNIKPVISFDESRLKTKLDGIAGSVYQPAIAGRIKKVDGEVVENVAGSPGRVLDTGGLSKQIVQNYQAAQPSSQLAATPIVTTARAAVSSSYSQTSKGLQTLINDTIGQIGGSHSTTVIELGGLGRQASSDGGKKFVTASTYKLFVAYGILKGIQDGRWGMQTDVLPGKNIGQCLDVMIVNSDNICAEAMGRMVGWGELDNMVHGLGLGSTFLNNYYSNGSLNGDKFSTSDDEANFLLKLHNQQLLDADKTSYLLSLMSRQVYREGIPKGVMKGSVVSDKVGFLGGYLNDAAVIYGQNRRYIMVVLTRGSSWSKIADFARAIDRYFNG